jgi:hypothetical protein
MRSRSRAKGPDAPAEDGARRGLPSLYSPDLLGGAFSETDAVGSMHLPSTVRTDDTLGEEPEVELALV